MADLIKGPGVYATRRGRLAFISGSETESGSKERRYVGSVLVLVRGKQVRESHVWLPDGRCTTSDHDGDAIVSPV